MISFLQHFYFQLCQVWFESSLPFRNKIKNSTTDVVLFLVARWKGLEGLRPSHSLCSLTRLCSASPRGGSSPLAFRYKIKNSTTDVVLFLMARWKGLEPLTYWFVASHSIQLSYQREYGADDEARTRYLHLGKVALYQMSYIRKCKKYYTYKTSTCQYFFQNNSKNCKKT